MNHVGCIFLLDFTFKNQGIAETQRRNFCLSLYLKHVYSALSSESWPQHQNEDVASAKQFLQKISANQLM